MKTPNAILAVALSGCALFATTFQGDAPPPTNTTVGTYDSRAIAIAYVGSEEFNSYLRLQKKDIDAAIARAKETGDHGMVTRLEALGPAMQDRIHRQGFGTEPVDDILVHIEDALPKVAKLRGVDLVVSKWAIDYQDPDAVFVDVTEDLAAEFGPSDKTWKSIRQIMKQDPVPADELGDH